MTAFDRFEQNLPELMSELASAQVPDYFDDMLRRTARTRQRPAWSAFERWLPMGVIARPAFLPRVPWRPIGILVILALLLAAGAVLLISSSQQRLPEPFGPARNGSILYSTADGDISSVDPATGTVRAIVTGPGKDISPLLSRDGTKFLFVRTGTAATNALFVSNIDGSGVRELMEGQIQLFDLDWSPFDWSPAGAQVAVTSTIDSIRQVTILATDGSSMKTLDLGMSVSNVSWRPNGRELVFRGEKTEASVRTYGLYLVNADGTGLHAIVPASNLEFGWRAPVLSPDGSLVAFSRWGSPSLNGIHVLGIDSGVDRLVEFDGSVDSDSYLPQFSPDGKQLAFQRYVGGEGEYQLVVVPAAGGGQAVSIGPRQPGGSADPFLSFSPDGSMVLATYPTSGKTWLLGTSGGSDRQVSWPGTEFQSWQRLAR